MTKPVSFTVSAYATCNNRPATAIGTIPFLSEKAMIEHVAAIHDCATGIEMMVFPINAQDGPALRADGSQYPIFVYRTGRETQLTTAQLREALQAYANSEAELSPA